MNEKAGYSYCLVQKSSTRVWNFSLYQYNSTNKINVLYLHRLLKFSCWIWAKLFAHIIHFAYEVIFKVFFSNIIFLWWCNFLCCIIEAFWTIFKEWSSTRLVVICTIPRWICPHSPTKKTSLKLLNNLPCFLKSFITRFSFPGELQNTSFYKSFSFGRKLKAESSS